MEMQVDIIKDLKEYNIYLLRTTGSKDMLSVGLSRANITYAILIHSICTARSKGETWQITLDELSKVFCMEKVQLRKYAIFLVKLGVLDVVDNNTFMPKMGSAPEQPLFIPVYTRGAALEEKDLWSPRTRILRSPRDTSNPPKLPSNAIGASPELFGGGHTLIAYNYIGLISGANEPINIIAAHSSVNKFSENLKAAWFASNGVKQIPNGYAILKQGLNFWDIATPEHFKSNDYCKPDCAPVPFWQDSSVSSLFGSTASESARGGLYRKLLLRTQDIVKDNPQLLPWITTVGVGNYMELVRESGLKVARKQREELIKMTTQDKTPSNTKVDIEKVKTTKPAEQQVASEQRFEPQPALSIRGRLNLSFTSSQLIRRVFSSDLDESTQDILVEHIIQARMWKHYNRMK